jgi:cellulose synthase/poly-beta-1,6-N-acetylglucosamine synthase-like glycosyltransferase
MKVTVAIPSYNAERWIAQAIQSALDQREVETEVIVVDDGSKDHSVEVAAGFGERIRLVAGENRGANHARNTALEMASGGWIQFLDADDYLEPGKIAQQLQEANGGADADLLYAPVWIETWKDGAAISREQSRTSPAADLDVQWIRWQIPQTGGALWRTAALRELGGWKPGQPCCQEHELYLRARKAGLRFRYTPSPGAVYRIWSEDTLCRKDPVKVTQVRTALMDEMWRWLEENGRATEEHRREIGQACFEMARTWARFDLSGATAYHRERKARGFIHPAGPAAPARYRLVYRLAGFLAAEKLAAKTR